MFHLARALMLANIRAENPNIAGGELRAKIFERTYHDDFSPEDQARILKHLGG